MQTLTLKNTMKNLTLVAVGALMAAMIAVPLAGSAAADDDDLPYRAPASAVTYSLPGSDGHTANFVVVERGGDMILVLDPIVTAPFIAPDDD